MTNPSTEATPLAALAGVIAAASALAMSHLLDGLSSAIPSLVVSVGDVVIDSAPSAVEQWAIATLGTYDKPALILGILVISAVIGAVLGVAGRRNFAVPVVGFAAFGVFGGWAAAAAAPAWAAWTVAALSVAAGLLGLKVLLAALPEATLRTGPRSVDRTTEHGSSAGRPPRAASGEAVAWRPEPAGRASWDASRRRFLAMAGGLGAAVVVSVAGGRYLLARRRPVQTTSGALPTPAVAAPDVDAAVTFDVDGLHPWITPNEDFFRIDTALRVPRVDTADWSVAVTGMVERPFELTYEELLAMPLEEHVITLACVSNEVGGDLVDNARWLGVRLDRLLERAGVQPSADQIVGRSVDGFSAGFPTEVAFDGRDALVAVGMNGEPLPSEHGYPARLVVPGLFGYVSATKWLSTIELTTLAGYDAYWIPRGWAKFGPVVTQSQIAVPRAGATVTAGPTAVAGIAYAPTRGIAAVEVKVDDAPWGPAELAASYNEDTWRQWLYRWDAEPGHHRLTVRATDGNDELQIAEVSPVAPDGATGLHTVTVDVV